MIRTAPDRRHATDATGRLMTGADVAVAVWRATPGENWLAVLFGNPVALPLIRFAYDRFADHSLRLGTGAKAAG